MQYFPVEVKITTDSSLLNVVQDKYAGFCTPNCPMSWTSAPFTQPGTYYWQVTTTDNGGSVNPASAVWSFTLSAKPPVVQSFSPAAGSAGSAVTLFGSGFNGATSVKFNGANASFSVGSDTQITTTVPSGATSGPISVSTPAGTAASSSSFRVSSPGGRPKLGRWHYSNGGPKAGANFDVLLEIVDSKSNKILPGGNVSCRAYVGSILLTPVRSGFDASLNLYGCLWHLPLSAVGKKLRATTSVSFNGVVVSNPVYRAVVGRPLGARLVFTLAPEHPALVAGQSFQATQSARIQFPNGSQHQINWKAKGTSAECAAHIVGGVTLQAGKVEDFPTGIRCTWEIPPSAKGRMIMFVMTIRAAGQVKSARFSARAG